MDGFELYDLGRKLMQIGEDAIPDPTGLRRLSAGVRLVMTDVFGHPDTSIADIAQRTGFPAAYVETSVAALRDAEAVTTAADPNASGRTVVSPVFRHNAADRAAAHVDTKLADAAGIRSAGETKEVVGTLERLASRLAGTFTPETPEAGYEVFEEQYAGTPPWDTGRPQAAIRALAEAGEFRGRVLEIGCGTGEITLMAAGLGLEAVGIDPASNAVEAARGKAAERGLTASFRVGNAFELSKLDERFDTVVDSGLFHVFSDPERVRYAANLAAVTAPGARLFVLCFSDRQASGRGPRRVSEDGIRSTFVDGWRVDSVEPAVLENNRYAEGAAAWLAKITRV